MLRFILSAIAILMMTPAQAQSAIETGRRLFTDAEKGNCIACHQVPADASVKSFSQIGPSLAGVKSRIADRAKLRALIWDPFPAQPTTVMPPFGRNRILTGEEIEAVARYVETL
jgi:sulfur-oxidizing protein SoxX